MRALTRTAFAVLISLSLMHAAHADNETVMQPGEAPMLDSPGNFKDRETYLIILEARVRMTLAKCNALPTALGVSYCRSDIRAFEAILKSDANLAAATKN